ncbi:MAG: phosphoribosylformylglycinamidine cyclo-ligase [Clostridia bacterium]|nr:phosphoribosylformylglycinamidine cyclo-ligase [Clostridia bacterium]
MISYKDSGVDVERGYEAVRLMKESVKSTYTDEVVGDIGSFGGFFSIPKGYTNPVLVAGTDGVGTKLRYAIISGKNDTIGIDAVAMCVNDIVCQGAKPIIFLDYIATGSLKPEQAASIVSGIAEGCRQAGCALIGGETAEMPGFYPAGEYDVAGFSVGIVDRDKIIDGRTIGAGDVLIGLPSSGIHSNGYSLVRRLFGEDMDVLSKEDPRLGGPVIDALLAPTRIYVKTILSVIQKVEVKGIAHITGGGFIENIPRMFPEGVGCEIDTGSYDIPPIFQLLQEMSALPPEKMYNTFNMGIGCVLCVAEKDVSAAVSALKELGEAPVVIGRTIPGRGVTLK